MDGATPSLNGFLLIDKPAGITSAQAVNRVKRHLPRGTKIGHAGTLDPFATGLLVLLIGKATKACERVMGQRKTYEATIKFGATTETDDPEAEEVPFTPSDATLKIPDRSRVADALAHLTGQIMQTPPVYSALKVAGKRAADRTRAGQHVELQPRPIVVYSIDLLSYEWPLAQVRIDCGRGTYIRAIARDVGNQLSVGGYLTALRRTRIGDFCVSAAVMLTGLDTESIVQNLIRVESVHQ